MDMSVYIERVARSHGQSVALYEAARWGELSLVKKVMQSGVRIDELAGDGGTALTAASFAGESQVVRYLLEMGADPNARSTRDGRTPIMACLGGVHSDEVYLDIVAQLIAAGADLSLQDYSRMTALDHANNRACKVVTDLIHDTL